MADDGPVPIDLGNIGTHDARKTQSDQDANNDMSYDDVCAIASKGYKAGKRNRQERTKRSRNVGSWSGRVAERDDRGRKGGMKGFEGSNSDWHGDQDKGSNGRKNKGKGESETRYCFDCGEQGHIGVNCPYKWTNSIEEENDRGSSWESELEGREARRTCELGGA